MGNLMTSGFGTSGGRKQIIGGQDYEQYSPQWYAAMEKDKINRAKVSGTAAGTAGKAALDALGQVSGSTSSASAGSKTANTGGGGFELPPRVGSGGGLPDYQTFDSGGSGGGGTGGVSPVTHISQPDQSAAEAAVFGKAKDQVGQETSGALAGLRSAMASRGLLGGQGEYRGTAGVINRGQGELGDVSRQQAVTHLGNEMDINKSNQAADLAGRGQDISANTARRGQNMDYTLGGRGQDVSQRGQDIQYAESQAQLAMTKSLQEAAQRQQILQGIMGAINGPSLY